MTRRSSAVSFMTLRKRAHPPSGSGGHSYRASRRDSASFGRLAARRAWTSSFGSDLPRGPFLPNLVTRTELERETWKRRSRDSWPRPGRMLPRQYRTSSLFCGRFAVASKRPCSITPRRVNTLTSRCARSRRHEPARREAQTYTFEICPVIRSKKKLRHARSLREQIGELRQRIEAHNASELRRKSYKLHLYVGHARSRGPGRAR